MNGFNAKRIADPVHGTIGLSELEVRVIGTRVFQRLRNVKQLGLASLVFPVRELLGFQTFGWRLPRDRAHSGELARDGVCDINDSEIQLYRLAGLLHDIGHYPFSHAMEDAIANYYSSRLLDGQEPVDLTQA